MVLPPVFVISPKELSERRAREEAHLFARGLAPTFFSGVYGPDVGMVSTRDDPGKPYSRLNAPKVALALNHWFLWHHIVMTGIPAAIIFEDDTEVPEDFGARFGQMLEQIPTWDMLYLGITYPERIEDQRIKTEQVSPGIFLHRGMNTFDGTVDGTWAYMLTQAAARTLTGMRFILDEPIDRWLTFNALPRLRTYICHPGLAKHRG